MNGRIIELARRATGRQVVGASDFADWDVIERLAESIVQECLSVVEAQKDRLSEDSMDWGDQDFGYSMAVNDSVAMVKQHFGVDE